MTTVVADAASPTAASTEQIAQHMLRARQRHKFQKILYGFIFPLGLLSLWELFVYLGVIDRRFFPAPSRILSACIQLLANNTERATLIRDIAVTYTRLALGFTIGSIGGIVVGILMALYAPLRFGIGPIVYATYPTPKLAIFPLLIVIFGIGDMSKTALVTLGVFYMTCINTLGGVLYANPIYGDVAHAFRMPPLTRWIKVVVPSAMPSIVTGLKLGLGQALILVVSAEFVAAENGIGYFIWNSWQVLDISRMFLGLVVVAITGGLAMLLGTLFERRLIPWATH